MRVRIRRQSYEPAIRVEFGSRLIGSIDDEQERVPFLGGLSLKGVLRLSPNVVRSGEGLVEKEP